MRKKTLHELDSLSKYRYCSYDSEEKMENPPAVEETKDSFLKRGIVNGELINLRTRPDLDGCIITRVHKGAELEILEDWGEMFKVRVIKTGDVGYMFSYYISEV